MLQFLKDIGISDITILKMINNNSFFSSFDNIGNFVVFTPHISTLFIK